MDAPRARERSARKPPDPRLSRVADQFDRVVSSIEARASDAVLDDALRRTAELCEQTASEAMPPEHAALLRNLRTAVGTWQQVWPRLGRQADFRQAVAREAQRWARELRHG